MKRKATYLVFCVLGVVLPYWQFVPWVVAQHGVPLGLFLRELFATRIGGFFGMDVLVSAVVLIFFVVREGKRLGVRHLWVPLVATLTVGVSVGFPAVSIPTRRCVGKRRGDDRGCSIRQNLSPAVLDGREKAKAYGCTRYARWQDSLPNGSIRADSLLEGVYRFRCRLKAGVHCG